ncbi:ABC transporter ATP-binding protein [Limimaricola pyoseonensis]|uniref:Iron complex transport system ATP-binding protein n=1 Tax=Limimaricola pyoseonensis TaxID=521013 RepID=A0A1G7G1W2_9RHOB|nr:ATP-binding cassette domain-containing protein [Limimaricola pyoseonensis]SDE82132.1 iron complex transport system ATP-binding protein [Limimaricola pyoseonensis]
MIEIRDVAHRAGPARILSDITLDIPRGGVTALIGPNGAGKSTLLSLVARLEPLQQGRITVDGRDVGRTPTDRLARHLSILRQDTGLAARLTVRDLVGFGRYPHHKGRPGPADRAAIADAIAAFDLEPLADRFTDTLSGGQRQRALVAMTWAQGTDYVLLDEPLNNLDMAHARALMLRLRDMAATGRTVVVVLHEVNYAAAHADHVVAMKDGRVARTGPAAEVLTGATLSRLFDSPVEMAEIGGRSFALHHG